MCSQKCARPEMFPGSDKEPTKNNDNYLKKKRHMGITTIEQSYLTSQISHLKIFFLSTTFREVRFT